MKLPPSFVLNVKVNQSKNEVMSYKDGIMNINIKEKAENNRANIEIIKFFKRKFKCDVKIVKGLTSRKKIIKVM